MLKMTGPSNIGVDGPQMRLNDTPGSAMEQDENYLKNFQKRYVTSNTLKIHIQKKCSCLVEYAA
jgi:hypothetical protein